MESINHLSKITVDVQSTTCFGIPGNAISSISFHLRLLKSLSKQPEKHLSNAPYENISVISVNTEITEICYHHPMKLTQNAQNFILHWGEMGNRWGVNRSVAQIHALLFYVGRPLPADDIVETLDIARSNVSNSLKELQNWSLIRVVHLMGDRREHFEANTDVWALLRAIVAERKHREFDPTIKALQNIIASKDFANEDAGAQLRVKETLLLMKTLGVWTEDVMRLESSVLLKLLKMGAKVSNLLQK